MSDVVDTAASTPAEACAQCSKALAPDDRVAAGDRFFCKGCYASLRAELEQAIGHMSTDINYVNAAVGGVLGGAVGVLAWWGFTVLTHIAFGLFAVAIGFLVGFGVVKFAGEKRSHGLQVLSIGIAVMGFVVATYLVNMTFINRAFADQGEALRIGFPAGPDMFLRVLSAGFGLMDLVFLAIVVYEAWKIPRPVDLPPSLTS